MNPFRGSSRGSRRASGARPTKAARQAAAAAPRPSIAARSPEAALGRATRGLVGPSRGNGSGGGRKGGGVGGGRVGVPTALRPLGRIRDRASGRRLVTPARAAGLLGMLAMGFVFTYLTGPTAFGLSRTELPELTWTDEATLAATLALDDGGNAFRLDTAPLEAALRTLPGVAGAAVTVSLPDAAVVVAVDERQPVLAWQVGKRRFLADAEGVGLRRGRVDRAAARRRGRRRRPPPGRDQPSSPSAGGSTRWTWTCRPAWAASRRQTSGARPRRSGSPSPTTRASSSAPRVAGPRPSGSTARRRARRT